MPITRPSRSINRLSLLAILVLVTLPRPARAEELLVFDWNGPVSKAERGFPWDQPPRNGANGDWTTPHDFAGGTLYCRVEIRSQPVVQDMNLQFCFWQKVPDRETCESHHLVKGSAGNVMTWSSEIASWWKKNDLPIDWTQPRDRNGVAIKDTSFQCVSDYSGWNWNGHDPDDWYPLDLRFTVVVVSKGGTFSGWANHIGTMPADAGTADARADLGSADGVVADGALADDALADGAQDGAPARDASSDVGTPTRDAAGRDARSQPSLSGSSGCAVTASPATPSIAWLLTCGLLLALRRRRPRRASDPS